MKTDNTSIETKAEKVVQFVRQQFDKDDFIPLHIPNLSTLETEKVNDALESTFVSSVGQYVNKVEEQLCEITGSPFAVATGTGTSALHIALLLAGVEPDTEVITQPLSFVATGNAISYQFAKPVFVDVDKETMGLSPEALEKFLEKFAKLENGKCINRATGNRISACVPMHTFGFPARIREIENVCNKYDIPLVEDAAESLGSLVGEQHTGTFGCTAAVSFNGNKIATAGGGGMILMRDESVALRAKHLTTTAKVAHKWEYFHDETGFNYRMPNLNAALLSAQLDRLPKFLAAKRELAHAYHEFFKSIEVPFIMEQPGTTANYWLMTVSLPDRTARDEFLTHTNSNGIMTRPAWQLLCSLPMFENCQTGELSNCQFLVDRIVNIPSTAIGCLP